MHVSKSDQSLVNMVKGYSGLDRGFRPLSTGKIQNVSFFTVKAFLKDVLYVKA